MSSPQPTTITATGSNISNTENPFSDVVKEHYMAVKQWQLNCLGFIRSLLPS